jgi:hypothetical protein
MGEGEEMVGLNARNNSLQTTANIGQPLYAVEKLISCFFL